MKILSQTTTLTLFALLMISMPLHAQWYTWTVPVSVTDSNSDNQNPSIRFLNFVENDYYMFWEKSTDTLSTDIYFRKFYSDDEAQIFLSEEGVHFTKPQMVDTWRGQSGDSSFYVFYESDIEGFNNIYYRVYNAPGFTEPMALTESNNEKTNLQCNSSGRIVWMEQNRIMHTKLNEYTLVFEEPFVIDSGNCSFPSIDQTDKEISGVIRMVAWIKEKNDSSKIMLRRYIKNEGWLGPETIFSGDQCTNLSFNSGMGASGLLSWDYFNDISWHILYFDANENQMYTTEFDQQFPYQPRYYSITFFVKSKYIEAGYSSFVYQHNDSVDIFSSDLNFNPPIEHYQNVSKSDNPVNNPQIFTGKFESPCNYYFINIWEEDVNDHWQLKSATTYACLSGIEEERESAIQLNASPNPFSDEVEISFSLDRPTEVLLSVYNANGKQMETLVAGKLHAGQHMYKWGGEMFKAGLYFVSLQINSKRVTQKIILTN